MWQTAKIIPCKYLESKTFTVTPPEGTLRVAVATFGNERWLPHLYPGAEDVVLKPMMENLLSRDLKTGDLTSLLAERWEVRSPVLRSRLSRFSIIGLSTTS